MTPTSEPQVSQDPAHGAPGREPMPAPGPAQEGVLAEGLRAGALLLLTSTAVEDGLPERLRRERIDLMVLEGPAPSRSRAAAALRWLRRGGALLGALGQLDDYLLGLLARAAHGRLVPLLGGETPRCGVAVGLRRVRAGQLGAHVALRLQLLALGGLESASPGQAHGGEPVAPAEDRERLEAELAALPPERELLRSGRYRVLCAPAAELPVLLRELGRLREVTFRRVGEGSGLARDLDRFDAHYEHLFIWNERERELVGAYRLGPSTRILAEHGPEGLYNVSLFRVDPRLFERLGPALELGRSFVAEGYQRSHLPLFLLFRGIGAWLLRNPEYRYLFGALSISSDFREHSRYLMQSFLLDRRPQDGLRELCSPPHALPRPEGWAEGLDDGLARRLLADLDELAAAVSDLEHGHRRPPVLLREYLRLGASVLATGVDPGFGNTLDALVLVDLALAERRLLERYLGSEVVRALEHQWGPAPCS